MALCASSGNFHKFCVSESVFREGPSEFTITGSLKTWKVIPQLPKIQVPILITNGAYDEAADSTIAPVWKALPRVKWYTFPSSAHMAQWEERGKFMEVVGGYLTLENV